MRRALVLVTLLSLAPLGEAVAQLTYGQCADRARDRFMRGQVDPTIGRDRALEAYTADLRECARIDAQTRAYDARQGQQRLDQQRTEQQVDQQRLDQQRLDQQRYNQQLDRRRLDQQRARQRDDMLRNQR
jgi:hypothetical protein